jgi:hypothetical protein
LQAENNLKQNKSMLHQVERVITAADRGYAREIVSQLRRIEKDYCISLDKEIEWLLNMVNLTETNEFKVGERVLFHCFDKSTIEVIVTEVDGDLVYGVSDKGTSHWANKKDVTKLK